MRWDITICLTRRINVTETNTTTNTIAGLFIILVESENFNVVDGTRLSSAANVEANTRIFLPLLEKC